MKLNAFSDEIHVFIRADRMKEALDAMLAFLKQTPYLEEVLAQSGRYTELKRQERLGIVYHEHANVEKNKIRVAILELLSEIRAKMETDDRVQKEIANANLKKIFQYSMPFLSWGIVKWLLLGASVAIIPTLESVVTASAVEKKKPTPKVEVPLTSKPFENPKPPPTKSMVKPPNPSKTDSSSTPFVRDKTSVDSMSPPPFSQKQAANPKDGNVLKKDSTIHESPPMPTNQEYSCLTAGDNTRLYTEPSPFAKYKTLKRGSTYSYKMADTVKNIHGIFYKVTHKKSTGWVRHKKKLKITSQDCITSP